LRNNLAWPIASLEFPSPQSKLFQLQFSWGKSLGSPKKYSLSSSLANNSSPNHSGAAQFSHSLSFPIFADEVDADDAWHSGISGQDGKQAGRMENWHAGSRHQAGKNAMKHKAMAKNILARVFWAKVGKEGGSRGSRASGGSGGAGCRRLVVNPKCCHTTALHATPHHPATPTPLPLSGFPA